MAVWNLEKKKAFLVYQVNRLTDMPIELAKTKTLSDLENIEREFYENKHPGLKGAPDYKPHSY